MYGKRFEKELKMIENALKSEEGEVLLREYCANHVEIVVKKLAQGKKFNDIPLADLISAGWAYFPKAVAGYKKRAELMLANKQEVYYFNTYLTWYIRQGVLDHVKSIQSC